MTAELAQLTGAHHALAVARTLEDVAAIRDTALAAKRYAEARKLGEDSVRYAQEIVLRATVRLGEILRDDTDIRPGRPEKTSSRTTISDYGISRDLSSRAQRLAAIPEPVRESFIANRRTRELSEKKLLRIGREHLAEQRRAEPIEPRTVDVLVDIRHGDFREVLADLEPGTVDLVFTDPPYPAEYLPLWSDLGKHAARWLRPGGLLVAYSGQTFLIDVANRLSEQLDYFWTYAVQHDGAFYQLHARRVQCGWKPLLVFRNGHGELPGWHKDFVSDGSREKSGHDWQQSEAEAGYWIGKLTQPDDLVVDPFLGSGTTAVACRDLNRRFIGCDVDAGAVATARQRLAREDEAVSDE